MLVDKMKELQLVAESKILKIDPTNRMFSRFDKTVYISEPIDQSITVTGETIGYVEASFFFNLFSEAQTINMFSEFCQVILKNGGDYKLPYYDNSWEDITLDTNNCYTVTIKLAEGRLSSATLKNLANPMLQCIYIDDATAVSCNSMVACIDGTVTSQQPLILPPDVIGLIEGSEATIYVTDKNYVLKVGNATVYVPIPGVDYKETADVLRGALPDQITRYSVSHLYDSIKRLSAAHTVVTFYKDKVVSDTDFEPFSFPDANEKYKYDVQSLLSILPQVKHIAQSDYALLLYGDQFLFMLSPEPTEGEAQQ